MLNSILAALAVPLAWMSAAKLIDIHADKENKNSNTSRRKVLLLLSAWLFIVVSFLVGSLAVSVAFILDAPHGNELIVFATSLSGIVSCIAIILQRRMLAEIMVHINKISKQCQEITVTIRERNSKNP